MKEKVISLVMAGLMGAAPLSSLAASENLHTQMGKAPSIIRQQTQKHAYSRDRERHERERREQERREAERRERERREQERREAERRERERREQERREAERRERERRERERQERIRREQQEDARYIIHRTAEVIFVAQRSTGRRHYYKGMAQAIAHQQKARHLYLDGFYQEAIFHSLRARSLAIQVIKGNQGKWDGSWEKREDNYRRIAPRDHDLDIKLGLIKIGDQEAIRISIDLDL